MKLSREFKAERCLSTDAYRPHITSAWLDVEAKRLVVTDGHALALIPVDVGPGDRSGPVSAEAVKRIRLSSTTATARRDLVVHGDVMYRRPKNLVHPAGTAEKRKSIMPTFKRGDAGTVSFGLSPALLLALSAAMGRPGDKGRGVCLTVRIPERDDKGKQRPMLDGILVTLESDDGDDDHPVGVLMPRRVS